MTKTKVYFEITLYTTFKFPGELKSVLAESRIKRNPVYTEH
jgi:hypothetical protein